MNKIYTITDIKNMDDVIIDNDVLDTFISLKESDISQTVGHTQQGDQIICMKISYGDTFSCTPQVDELLRFIIVP